MSSEQHAKSDRQELSEIVQRHRDCRPGSSRDDVVDNALGELRDLWPDLHEPAWRVAFTTLYEEIARRRTGVAKLRNGHTISLVSGIQLSLPLLGMSIPQGREIANRLWDHARGATERAAHDSFVVALATRNCRERGLDPDLTDFVIGDFVTEDEIAEAWRAESA